MPVATITKPTGGATGSNMTSPIFERAVEATFFLPQRLKRLLKKSERQVPRGLKSARKIKNKGLIGTTEVVP